MDWIKKNTEKFVLLLFSIALIAVAVLLVLNAQKLLASFDPLTKPPAETSHIPPLNPEGIKTAQAALDKPATWDYDKDKNGILFASRVFFISDKGDPIEPKGGMFYPPVPNDWLMKNNLDITDPQVLTKDADGDGYSNLEEFLMQTDPTDPNSHPPYITKLFLEKYIKIPFRLEFMEQPDDTTYEINALDAGQPTQFLKMGDLIAGTKYKLVKFEKKSAPGPDDMVNDVSELTIEHTETGKQIILVKGKVTDDPDSYAQFRYLWKKNTPIKVKLQGTFTLDPETDIT
ncbi:MAG TPA: Amuc_1099 family pilus-like system protein, partial [Verrucomicrobiae bacterium]|nr:Amuc_1099 family pilus-like system protein [Verrucomicrobiae bacterium]